MARADGASSNAPSSNAASPSPEDRRAAADAYDKGSARYLLRDYAGAAEWFELADRLAPDTSALRSAIRAHKQIGSPPHMARAATLALRLKTRIPNDAAANRSADEVIASASSSLGRVIVRCQGCQIEVDGVLEAAPDLFATPGEHKIVGHWPNGQVASKAVDVRVGQKDVLDWMDVKAVASTPPKGTSTTPGPAAALQPSPGESQEPSKGLPPVFALSGAALTAVLGGATAVSWFADAVPAGNKLIRDAEATHVSDPAQEDRVQGAETRTTVLLAATACTAAATLVVGLVFTRWSGAPRVDATTGRASLLQASF
ncbi:hypothetical protein AKJ09_02767 [Labilithrix luteola]|uniref:Tetratricopeptide repeat protein n=2 Tax=Labilithrix luteola TaxID=1391654 RepID=A0A0K1PRE3_9BACT|nr:hypothetical protein AKJ09_02767 [Labilithrix luteola]